MFLLHGRSCRLPGMVIAESQWENKTKRQGITGKGQPDVMPVFNAILCKMIYYPPAADTAQVSAQPIGHDHEQPLSAGPDVDRGFFLDKQRTRNIEEVEGHT